MTQKLPPEQKCSEVLMVRMTPGEKRKLIRLAKKAKIGLGAWLKQEGIHAH